MNERLSNAQKLAEKINEQQHGRKMEVTVREVTQGLIDFTQAGDEEGVRNLFDAIYQFKINLSQPGDNPTTIRRRTLEEIDFVSRIANEMDKGHHYSIAIALVQIAPPQIGRVTFFCRQAIGYRPADFEN